MAFIDPPIEKVIDMAGSRYALCTVVTKRAKELLLEKPESFLQTTKKLSLLNTQAASFMKANTPSLKPSVNN